MGTEYGKIGNHLHIEIAKGKFHHMYDHNKQGYYLPGGIAIENCCFADGTNLIGNSKNWNWKYIKDVSVKSCPYKSSGIIKAIYNGIRVRTSPSTKKGDTGKCYNIDSAPLYYNRIVEGDGYYWAEYDRSVGGKGYCALCKIDGSEKLWQQIE